MCARKRRPETHARPSSVERKLPVYYVARRPHERGGASKENGASEILGKFLPKQRVGGAALARTYTHRHTQPSQTGPLFHCSIGSSRCLFATYYGSRSSVRPRHLGTLVCVARATRTEDSECATCNVPLCGRHQRAIYAVGTVCVTLRGARVFRRAASACELREIYSVFSSHIPLPIPRQGVRVWCFVFVLFSSFLCDRCWFATCPVVV